MTSEARAIHELSETIARIKDRTTAEGFLRNILTPAELDEIARRLQIFKQLKKGVPQRRVAKSLGVSIGTVSRGARELKYGVPGVTKLLLFMAAASSWWTPFSSFR